MKLISVDAAQASITIVPDEVRPLVGTYLPDVFAAMAQRYALQYVPTLEETRKTGAIFREGRFFVGDRQINILNLGIFNDGLRAVTADTADSDAVIDDLAELLKSQFQFRDPITPPLRHYQGDLVFSMECDPSASFAKFAPLVEFIRANWTSAEHIGLSHIAFASEGGGGSSPPFTLERRLGVPWNRGLWFSKAHLQTATHIRALQILDDLLAAG